MTTATTNENRSARTLEEIKTKLAEGYTEVHLSNPCKFSHEELRAAFAGLRLRSNWKEEIEDYVDLADIPKVAAAIAFMTGSESYAKLGDGGHCAHVYAPGYYETIGA